MILSKYICSGCCLTFLCFRLVWRCVALVTWSLHTHQWLSVCPPACSSICLPVSSSVKPFILIILRNVSRFYETLETRGLGSRDDLWMQNLLLFFFLRIIDLIININLYISVFISIMALSKAHAPSSRILGLCKARQLNDDLKIHVLVF